MSAPASRDDRTESQSRNRRYEIFAWLLILLGIALRLRTYLSARALRRDESNLSLNLLQRSFSGLLQPLDHDQGAPIGFLMLEKWSITVLGRNEYALRLVPLLAGIGSLPLFWIVARRILGLRAGLIALGLFVASEPLVYYASEVKQYSSDVAITLALLVAATADRENDSLRRPVLLALLGSAAIWLSHPSLFVLGGIGLAALIFDRRRAETLAVAGCWAASFFIDHHFFLRALQTNESLLDFWTAAFMPFPPRSTSDARWFLTTLFDIFKDPVGLPFTGLAAALGLLGIIALARTDRRTLTLLTTPIVLTLVASGLRKYPFSTRLILFTVPMFLILIASGVAFIGKGGDRDRRISAGVLLAVLALHPAMGVVRNLIRPMQGEELKEVLRAVASRREPGDRLYLYFASEPAFRFYTEYADRPILPGAAPIVGSNGRADRSVYARDVERLRGQGRVWVIFSHAIKPDEQYLLDRLDENGKRIDQIEAFGASAYLYEMAR